MPATDLGNQTIFIKQTEKKFILRKAYILILKRKMSKQGFSTT